MRNKIRSLFGGVSDGYETEDWTSTQSGTRSSSLVEPAAPEVEEVPAPSGFDISPPPARHTWRQRLIPHVSTLLTVDRSTPGTYTGQDRPKRVRSEASTSTSTSSGGSHGGEEANHVFTAGDLQQLAEQGEPIRDNIASSGIAQVTTWSQSSFKAAECSETNVVLEPTEQVSRVIHSSPSLLPQKAWRILTSSNELSTPGADLLPADDESSLPGTGTGAGTALWSGPTLADMRSDESKPYLSGLWSKGKSVNEVVDDHSNVWTDVEPESPAQEENLFRQSAFAMNGEDVETHHVIRG